MRACAPRRLVKSLVTRAQADAKHARNGSGADQKGGAAVELHRARKPYKHGHLKVSEVHTIAYSEYGNPRGVPAIVLHGGPGAGCFPRHTQFFDLKRYRVVLLDQRGCGASTPHGCLVDNDTAALVSDIEAVRVRLEIRAWMLFAGSWGVTLALAYSIQYPQRHEIDWVFRGGCKAVFPAAWEAFTAGLSQEELQDPLQAYYARLTSGDASVRQSASKRMFLLQASLSLPSGDQVQVWDGAKWDRCELSAYESHAALPRISAQEADSRAIESLPPYSMPANEQYPGDLKATGAASAQQLLTAHYSMRNGFEVAAGVLQNIDCIRQIPAIAVHGRNDMVCPVTTAYDLHLAWPELELQIVTAAGHSMYDQSIACALLKATDRMDRLIRARAKSAKRKMQAA